MVFSGAGVNGLEGKEVAMKLEGVNAKHSQLKRESRLLTHLQGAPGAARGSYCDAEVDLNIIVMELLGPSREDLSNLCSRQSTLCTLLMIADQLLDRIESVDSENSVECFPEPECL
ncbi:hypothetical protein Emed_000364 [Eimeria media]